MFFKNKNCFFQNYPRLVLLSLFLTTLPPVLAQGTGSGISAGLINVVQNDESNTTDSVTLTVPVSINGFFIRDGSTRGDYFVQVGPDATDDVTNGVMMSCIAENGRDNGETNSPGFNYCTSTVDYSRTGGNAGGFYISSFTSPSGGEYNINTAAAYFPYSEWIGGLARNSGATNGGANNLFNGSPGLVLGTHFIDNGGGNSTVNLTSLGIDSRTDGILLVTHGKNEDNYAASMVNTNDGTWTVFIKDNGTDAGSYEQDPVAFVYIPRTNSSVISGRFRGDGTVLMYSGASAQFNVTNTSVGTWKLTIPGQTPSSGVLIISAEGGFSQNQDNIVSYAPDTNGWIIQSRDINPPNAPGLQTPGGGTEPAVSFVFIPAPAAPTLISPPDGAQNIINSPALQVVVSNSVSTNLTVTFYGRPAATNTSGDFEIIALPDTQFYTDSAHGAQPAMFYSQTEWIITNRLSRNIPYVVGLGDIVDHGDNNGGTPFNEWKVATNALYRMENASRTALPQGIPYGTAVGNHDESPNGDSTGTTTYYNQFFGVNHFAGRSYYAGYYGTTNNNHFDFFTAGGMDFIVLYFEYDTTLNQGLLNWGSAVLTANANRRAIIVTHNFGNTATPLTFSAQGQAIYNMAKLHTNVFMMLAGHVTGQGSRTDTYNGHTIHTFVSDYQGWTNGGNGFLRMIDFSPANDEVVLTTYSPWTGKYDTGPGSELFFSYNMASAGGGSSNAPFLAIGTNYGVTAGNVTSCVWTGLQSYTAYEWYVTVADDLGNLLTSGRAKFITAPNSPPTVSNVVISVFGDAPTNLTLHAFDLNGDPLTFQTNSLPTHGMNLNFDPTNGTLQYVPIRGYRGFDRFTFSAHDASATSSVATMNINIGAPPDTNADGIADAWAAAYGITNALADSDGDGRSNLEEYLANTDPNDQLSVFRIASTTRDPAGHVTLKWQAVGGTRYRVQYSNGDLNNFIDVVRPLNIEMPVIPYGTTSNQTFIDDFTLTGVPSGPARYYRVKITQ